MLDRIYSFQRFVECSGLNPFIQLKLIAAAITTHFGNIFNSYYLEFITIFRKYLLQVHPSCRVSDCPTDKISFVKESLDDVDGNVAVCASHEDLASRRY